MYLGVLAVLHYNNYDGDIHACILKACISSKYSKCISAIKCILYTTAMYISSSSFVYLCFSLYCDACLKSSVLRVGVKTLHNTLQSTSSVAFWSCGKKSPRGIELNKFILVNPGKEIALLNASRFIFLYTWTCFSIASRNGRQSRVL